LNARPKLPLIYIYYADLRLDIPSLAHSDHWSVDIDDRTMSMDYYRPEPRLCCYRLGYKCTYDEESVWAYVQGCGGHLSIRQDSIDFWVDPSHAVFLVMRWPDLERRSDLDLI
jgi:hypothetical protein